MTVLSAMKLTPMTPALPHNKDAERSVLGSVLRDNKIMDDIGAKLSVDDFYVFANQKLWQAYLDLYKDHRAIDAVTLADLMNAKNLIQDIGGYEYFVELHDAAPSVYNALEYVKIVRDKSKIRNLIHTCNLIIRDCMDGVDSPDSLIESAEQKIFEISNRDRTSQISTIREAIMDASVRLEERVLAKSTGKPIASGVMSSWSEFDGLTCGLQNEELVIVASRPGVGKTAVAINLAYNVAARQDLPVFFVALEQGRIELAERLACIHGLISAGRVRSGDMKLSDQERWIEAKEFLETKCLYFDDTPTQSVLHIAANARRMKRQHGIRLLMVDYLQLIEPEERRVPRHEQVASDSRRFKLLARELGIPVVVLAQVNRGSEERQDKRPRVSDLRESGAVEQDANTVILLHMQEKQVGEHGPDIMEVIVGKQRNGPTGTVKLEFRKDHARLYDIGKAEEF